MARGSNEKDARAGGNRLPAQPRHPGALAALKKVRQQAGEFLTRHVSREWGDLLDEAPPLKIPLLKVLYI